MLDSGAAPAKTAPDPAARKAPATKKRATRKKAAKKKAAKNRPAKKKTAKRKSAKRTDWNAILGKLPASFTAAQVKEAAGGAANDADVHQALLRWRTAGRVTTTGRGQYQKA